MRFSRRTFHRASILSGFSGFWSGGERKLVALILTGGMSPYETFSPEEHSPYRTITTATPGLMLSELLPKLSRWTDRMTIVRCVSEPGAPQHERARRWLCGGGVQHSWSLTPGLFTPEISFPLISGTSLREQFSTALRELESGTRAMTINMFDRVHQGLSWDMHAKAALPVSVRDYGTTLCPILDQELSLFLEQLSSRRMLDTTQILLLTDFGRSRELSSLGGREHSSEEWTQVWIGGGLGQGRVIESPEKSGTLITPQEFLVRSLDWAKA